VALEKNTESHVEDESAVFAILSPKRDSVVANERVNFSPFRAPEGLVLNYWEVEEKARVTRHDEESKGSTLVLDHLEVVFSH
jgi:hypothetical protein